MRNENTEEDLAAGSMACCMGLFVIGALIIHFNSLKNDVASPIFGTALMVLGVAVCFAGIYPYNTSHVSNQPTLFAVRGQAPNPHAERRSAQPEGSPAHSNRIV